MHDIYRPLLAISEHSTALCKVYGDNIKKTTEEYPGL